MNPLKTEKHVTFNLELNKSYPDPSVIVQTKERKLMREAMEQYVNILQQHPNAQFSRSFKKIIKHHINRTIQLIKMDDPDYSVNKKFRDILKKSRYDYIHRLMFEISHMGISASKRQEKFDEVITYLPTLSDDLYLRLKAKRTVKEHLGILTKGEKAFFKEGYEFAKRLSLFQLNPKVHEMPTPCC